MSWESLMNEIGKRVILNLQDNLKKQGLQNSRIIDDLSYELDIDDDEYELIFRVPNYGIYIEKGRKPNSKMPPKKPIDAWLKRKNIPIGASFPIRKKIAEDGIKPRPFLDTIAKTIVDTEQAFLEQSTSEIYIRLKDIFKNLE